MACYVVPLLTAILHSGLFGRGKDHSKLSLLLYGAAAFGVIDHAWNAELLSFTVPDLMLGFVITVSIVIGWGVWTLLAARTGATAPSVH
ncbi:hypothetical protein JXB02_04675 [Candidatus Woesearchaeota archaeon]|nr:hypothetical protein [Candidatus Woesearchaeota archaeon]